jgi:hypothetical protein
LAGCATQSPGPIGPISTGNPRVDPVPTGETDPIDEVDTETDIEQPDQGETEQVGPYTPPHMMGRDIVRAGVMLPFSHPRASVRQQAEGMLAGIELALFDQGFEDFVLLPKDTGGSQTLALTAAEELRDSGADLILGPLFGANVTTVRDVMSPEGKPVVAFSNDSSVASYGAWLASIAPEEEVASIVEYAALRGYDQFAFFGPQSDLGMKIERAMQREVMNNGGVVLSSAFYPSGTISPSTEAEYFAKTIEAAVERGARIAVLVPERGTRLRRIAPLLAYRGVDTRVVKMLGTSDWNDAEIWREPSLRGAWFPSSPSLEMADFEARYQRQYGTAPSSLAAVAYDAAALTVALSADGVFDQDELISRDGFMGLNGLFRFRADGTVERSLAIMEIDPNAETGVKEILPVSPSFDPPIG